MTVGSEGSGDISKLSIGGGKLDTFSWEAYGVCKSGMAKFYLWELAEKRAFSITISILFCVATCLA